MVKLKEIPLSGVSVNTKPNSGNKEKIQSLDLVRKDQPMLFPFTTLGVLKKYAVFSGRARRKEFWYFILFYYLIYWATIIIDIVMFDIPFLDIGPLGGFYMLATLIPYLSVTFRRLHDTNRSGWWILLLLPISFVSGFILAVFGISLEGDISLGELAVFYITIFVCSIPLIVFFFRTASPEKINMERIQKRLWNNHLSIGKWLVKNGQYN